MELNAGVAVGAPVGEVVESAEFVAERRRQKGLERLPRLGLHQFRGDERAGIRADFTRAALAETETVDQGGEGDRTGSVAYKRSEHGGGHAVHCAGACRHMADHDALGQVGGGGNGLGERDAETVHDALQVAQRHLRSAPFDRRFERAGEGHSGAPGSPLLAMAASLEPCRWRLRIEPEARWRVGAFIGDGDRRQHLAERGDRAGLARAVVTRGRGVARRGRAEIGGVEIRLEIAHEPALFVGGGDDHVGTAAQALAAGAYRLEIEPAGLPNKIRPVCSTP